MIALFNGSKSTSSFKDLKDNGITSLTSFDDKFFQQTADISITTALTEGIGNSTNPFNATYDGNGKKITASITVDSDNNYCALFAYTSDATIQNLTIEGTNDASANSSAYCAGIIAYVGGTTNINNCIVNVALTGTEGSTKMYGLAGGLSSAAISISDSYNKAARDLDFSSVSNTSETHYSATVATGEGTKNYPLQVTSLDGLKVLSDCGLYYQLADNLKVQSDRVYDYIENKSLIPGDASNNDYYIEKFCGTIDGNAHAISGITDKALFGTIVGNTTIDKVAFVNCYNATNSTVKLANSITDENTLSLSECYADTHFAFTDKATVKDNCYEYNNGNVIYYISGTQTAPTWIKDALSHRYILADNCVDLGGDSKTDYCSRPLGNTVVTTADKDFADYKYYNVTYLNNGTYTPIHLYLVDVMDFYNPEDKTYYGLSDEKIAATDFSSIPTGATVESVYYCRKAHNDWESVCLPFTYKLSDVQGYGTNFTAYSYDEYADSKANFKQMTNGATIEAGQPVLFKTEGGKDFVVTIENPTITTTASSDDKFHGALAHIENCQATWYKINGEATEDGGTLLKCNDKSWIYPFRAYLDLSGSDAKSIIFSVFDNEPCDVNGDASVNIADVNAVIGAMCIGSSSKIYDINKDGVINIADVNAIISTMCGK